MTDQYVGGAEGDFQLDTRSPDEVLFHLWLPTPDGKATYRVEVPMATADVIAIVGQMQAWLRRRGALQ